LAVTGQFYYLGQGNPTDARLAYINIDASSGSNSNGATTVLLDNNPAVDLKTGFPQQVEVDWAAGIYYVISNGGPTGANAQVLMGHIGGAAPTVVWTPASQPSGSAALDIANKIQIDPYTHHLYIGYTEASGGVAARQGILDFTYDTSSGAITPVSANSGYLVTQTQANIQSSVATGIDVFDARDFALDHAHHLLFFTQRTDGDGFESNEVYRIDLNNPTAPPVALVSQALFPWDYDGSNFGANNGAIIDVEVDSSTGLV